MIQVSQNQNYDVADLGSFVAVVAIEYISSNWEKPGLLKYIDIWIDDNNDING